MATIKDVARKTGLSVTTISKYINGGNVLDKNKPVIEEAIQQLDYKINEMARGLKTNKTKTVGVLLPSLESTFFTRIVSVIENILLSSGYSTIICDYNNNVELEHQKLKFLINKKVDGLILVPVGLDASSEEVKEIADMPVVLIDRVIQGASFDTVLVDNLNASYNAVEELIVRGHKRIGIIIGPTEINTAEERLEGYKRVHNDYAMEIDSCMVKYGNYEMETGYSLFNELLDMETPPTAIFVTNYEMTLGAVVAANERNIVIPDMLSFIGFDNLEMARIVKPSLSVVVQPMELIGQTAANVLLKRLAGDFAGSPSLTRLKTSVIISESVGRIC